MEGQKRATKLIAQNKKAYHEFFIEKTYETGIALTGTEVKSVRMGRVNLKESFAFIKDGEVYVRGMHISPYEQGNIYNVDPLRERKLLLHKKEISRLIGLVQQEGYSLVPVKLYFSGKHVKLELSLAKGKKLHDKRATEAERDSKRRIEQTMKNR